MSLRVFNSYYYFQVFRKLHLASMPAFTFFLLIILFTIEGFYLLSRINSKKTKGDPSIYYFITRNSWRESTQ